MKIIAATSNVGKVKEIKKIFSSPDFEIISMSDAGINIDVEENGKSFAENALIKARAISKLTTYAVLADDSGLCVNFLNGAPGIYSARYAGNTATDDDRIQKLLQQMKNAKDRAANFTCAVALILPDKTEIVTQGDVFGTISESPIGVGGFGYDPIFISDELKKSFGMATPEEKNRISHRGRALGKLYEILKERGLI